MKDFLELMQEGERLAEVRSAGQSIEKFEEKIRSLVELIVNKKGYRSSMRKAMLEEAATVSEFPILFGTILDRQLLAKYAIAKPDWRAYIKTGTQMDFRPQQPIGVFGLQGVLPSVPSRAEYKQDASLGSGAVTINVSKFGRRFGLGWEILINDDLGAFSDIAERLANAALRTEFRQATQLLVKADGNGPNDLLFGAPIVHPVDGKNVTNKLTGAGSALAVAGVATAIQKFREFVDADGEPIIVDGWEMVVPPALEVTMYQVLQSQLLIAAGGDATAGTKVILSPNKNVIGNFSITGHVNPYLPILDTSANKNTTWYLVAKLSNGAAAQLNFLRGHESPEIVMKNPNKVSLGGGTMNPLEGDFESDAIDWRVRHIMGGAAIDPRMAIANVGA
jgi:hypothetical protein